MLAYSGRGTFVIESIDLSALIEDMLDLLEKHHLQEGSSQSQPGEGSAPSRG